MFANEETNGNFDMHYMTLDERPDSLSASFLSLCFIFIAVHTCQIILCCVPILSVNPALQVSNPPLPHSHRPRTVFAVFFWFRNAHRFWF